MDSGLTYDDCGEMTVGQLNDFIVAKGNNAHLAEEYRKEKKNEEVLGRWASKPEDFAMLRG